MAFGFQPLQPRMSGLQDITQGSTSRLDGLVPWEQRRPVVIFRGTQVQRGGGPRWRRNGTALIRYCCSSRAWCPMSESACATRPTPSHPSNPSAEGRQHSVQRQLALRQGAWAVCGTSSARLLGHMRCCCRLPQVRAATAALSHPDILDVKLYSHCVPPEARNCQNRDLNATLFGECVAAAGYCPCCGALQWSYAAQFRICVAICSTIPMERQFHYKYQLDIDGHGGTFRLKHLMLSGSLVFKVDSPLFQPWMLALVPWVSSVFLQQLRRCWCAPPATQHSLNCNCAGSFCACLMA